MNPTATTAARTITQSLIDAGVRYAVICPGSRSAPLAYALHTAAASRHLNLAIRIDERVAGFTALGIGKATGQPAAVITTSGTAVANLQPAIWEAHHAHVPLVVLSADRPQKIRASWANQTTTAQAHAFGDLPRYHADLDTQKTTADNLRAAVHQAVHNSQHHHNGPGPSHLNCCFTEPLTPPESGPTSAWQPNPAQPPTQPPKPRPEPNPKTIDLQPGTVVIAGDNAGPAATEYAEKWHLPLFAEPSSFAKTGPHSITGYRLLADHPALGGQISQTIVFGRPTLTRPITALLQNTTSHIVAEPHQPAPAHPHHHHPNPPKPLRPSPDEWLQHWQHASTTTHHTITQTLADWPRLTGPAIAHELAKATHEETSLVASASNSIRDLDLAPAGLGWRQQHIYANRGLAGIDGTIATATGIATARGHLTRCFLGDLACLHDAGALALPHGLTPPHLQIVLNNDQGGGIFSLLEYPHASDQATFERLFGTRTTTNFAHLAASWQIPHTTISTADALASVLQDPAPGITLVECQTHREDLEPLHQQLHTAVHQAINHT